jgi:para-aminobenzoate synthetase component 1
MLGKTVFQIDDNAVFVEKALRWANRQPNFCYLNGNNIAYNRGSFPIVLAVGNQLPSVVNSKTALTSLFDDRKWKFGFLSYDSFSKKNSWFSNSHFFIPDTLLHFNGTQVEIETEQDPELIWQQIQEEQTVSFKSTELCITSNIGKDSYVETIEKLQQHLHRGDIYQINYCLQFSSSNAEIDPISLYLKLNTESPMPFSGLMKMENRFVICASPERYLKRKGSEIVSQPMKGTAPQDPNPKADELNKLNLLLSAKERAENTMIVDLVRNDLSQFCESGSVMVEKWCEIYSLKPVHQMVSTVVGSIESQFNSDAAIWHSFPMGSMTGAPKIRAMELIEQYETFSRGAFSGSLGYIEPNGDFDFNVLIRSIFYDKYAKEISYSVGSGITALSDPLQEFQECMLKAQSIERALSK